MVLWNKVTLNVCNIHNIQTLITAVAVNVAFKIILEFTNLQSIHYTMEFLHPLKCPVFVHIEYKQMILYTKRTAGFVLCLGFGGYFWFWGFLLIYLLQK